MLISRRVIIAAVIIALACAIATTILHNHSGRDQPVVNCVSMEPAGMFDDSGAEMRMLTLSITAPTNRSPVPLFFKQAGRSVEVKIGDQWIGVDTAFWAGELWPRRKSEKLILVPTHVNACRLRLQFTHALMTETQSIWLIKRLPTWSPFYRQAWTWLRNSPYKPSRSWRKVTVEVQLSP